MSLPWRIRICVDLRSAEMCSSAQVLRQEAMNEKLMSAEEEQLKAMQSLAAAQASKNQDSLHFRSFRLKHKWRFLK